MMTGAELLDAATEFRFGRYVAKNVGGTAWVVYHHLQPGRLFVDGVHTVTQPPPHERTEEFWRAVTLDRDRAVALAAAIGGKEGA